MNDKQMEANQTIWPWEDPLNCGRHNVWNGKTNNLPTNRQENFYAEIALYYSFHQNFLELKYIIWIKAAFGFLSAFLLAWKHIWVFVLLFNGFTFLFSCVFVPEFVIVNALGVFLCPIYLAGRVCASPDQSPFVCSMSAGPGWSSLLHTTQYTFCRITTVQCRTQAVNKAARLGQTAPMLHHWLHWVEHDQWCLHEAFNLFSSSSNPELIVCSRVVEKALFNWYRTDFVEANMTNQIVTQFHLVFDLFVVWRLLQKLH